MFDPSVLAPGDEAMRPVARPGDGTIAPPENARTVEDFDTTSSEERTAAVAKPVSSSEVNLGATVASLGDVSRPGFWLETPLVDKVTTGRVVYGATGKSVSLELFPIDGPATGGSRISLSAIRLLGAPLTGLPELTVFASR